MDRKDIIVHMNVEADRRKCWASSALKIVLVSMITMVLGFLLGWFLSTWAHRPAETLADSSTTPTSWHYWQRVEEVPRVGQLLQHMDAQNIENTVSLIEDGNDLDRAVFDVGQILADLDHKMSKSQRWLSKHSRLAGTDWSQKYAEDLVSIWQTQGMDTSGMESYDVLLSYPGDTEPYRNKVQLLASNGTVLFETPHLPTNTSHLPEPYPYIAYARPGVVEGDLLFVGTGSSADIGTLIGERVNFTNKILLTNEYFHLTSLAKKGRELGALGVLCYQGRSPDVSAAYPDGPGLPRDAIRLGALASAEGDILTPIYPAKDYTWRRSEEEVDQFLTALPIQPVSLETAQILLESVEVDTRGTPPGSRKMRERRRVRLEVHNRLERRRIYNAFAMVKGAVEEDRLVILGSHRDAWGRGALDAGSGTAVMMEVSKAVGQHMKLGWRPRRTLIFASWGAEEMGVIGSSEWVQEKLGVLQQKAVCYLNSDVAVTGTDILHASASPLLHHLIFNASHAVPHHRHSSVLAAWANYSSHHGSSPKINSLQPVSDFTAFAFTAGVPSADVFYANQDRPFQYPTYHTHYDSFEYVKTQVDPEFIHHRLIAQVIGEMMQQLADLPLLPLDVTGYAAVIMQHRERLLSAEMFTALPWLRNRENAELIAQLGTCMESFSHTAMSFQGSLENLDMTDPLRVRQANDRLMQVERAFINPDFNGDSLLRHVLLSPSNHTCAFAMWFPRLQDVVCDPENEPYIWNHTVPDSIHTHLRKEVTVLCYALDTATDMLII